MLGGPLGCPRPCQSRQQTASGSISLQTETLRGSSDGSVGFSPRWYEAWLGFQAPDFNPSPNVAVAGIRGVNHRWQLALFLYQTK